MKYDQPYGLPNEVVYGDTPYVNGNPSTGTQGSIPPAAAVEYPQREIVNTIMDCGLTATNSNLHQLGEAVQTGKLFYGGVAGGSSTAMTCTLVPAPTAWHTGMVIVVKMSTDCPGGA